MGIGFAEGTLFVHHVLCQVLNKTFFRSTCLCGTRSRYGTLRKHGFAQSHGMLTVHTGGLRLPHANSSIRCRSHIQGSHESKYVVTSINSNSYIILLNTSPSFSGSAKYATDFIPVEEGCPCPTCSDGTTRAMLHHIVAVETAAAHGTSVHSKHIFVLHSIELTSSHPISPFLLLNSTNPT